jgi:hypothetical protein
MTFQIFLMDELIARARTDREKARASLRRELKEAQDRTNAEAWQLAHPPPPPTLRIVHRRGWHTARQDPLEEEDLYLDDTRPRDIAWPKLEHTCRLCLNTNPILSSPPLPYRSYHLADFFLQTMLWL